MTCDNCKIEISEGYYLNHPVIKQTGRGNEIVLGKTVCCDKCHANINNKFINSSRVQEGEIMNDFEPIIIRDENESPIVEENICEGFPEPIKEATIIPPSAENTRPTSDIEEKY